jgi:hypothetical protein
MKKGNGIFLHVETRRKGNTKQIRDNAVKDFGIICGHITWRIFLESIFLSSARTIFANVPQGNTDDRNI